MTNSVVSSPHSVKSSAQSLFLSHSWQNNKTIDIVKQHLIESGYNVLNTGGKGDISAMAQDIEISNLVLIALSDAYKENKQCKNEAFYAVEQEKPIIILKMEKNCKTDGWFSECLNTYIIVDISATLNKKHPFEKLDAEIGKSMKFMKSKECEQIKMAHPIFDNVKDGNLDVIQAIVNAEGDKLLEMASDDSSGDLPIHKAARYGQTEVVKYFIELGCNVESKNKLGATPLHVSCLMGHLHTVDFLVKNLKCDVHAKDNNQWLPIHLAASGGHALVIETLLDQDPDLLNAKTGDDDFHSTPLMEAARNGHFEVVNMLIEKGADKNEKNSKSNNILHLASVNDHVAVVEFLVNECGLNIEERGQFGRTPLLSACAHGSGRVTKFLLEKGADLFACSEAEQDNASTACHLAAASGSDECLDIIFSFVFESCDFQGRTPLHRYD